MLKINDKDVTGFLISMTFILAAFDTFISPMNIWVILAPIWAPYVLSWGIIVVMMILNPSKVKFLPFVKRK